MPGSVTIRDRSCLRLRHLSTGKKYSNANRLMQCKYNNLINLVFGHKMVDKLIWLSLDGNTDNVIDYVIVNRILAGSVQEISSKGLALIYVKKS